MTTEHLTDVARVLPNQKVLVGGIKAVSESIARLVKLLLVVVSPILLNLLLQIHLGKIPLSVASAEDENGNKLYGYFHYPKLAYFFSVVYTGASRKNTVRHPY